MAEWEGRVKERPIIFGADSVRQILDGNKTMTRRVVKHKEPFYDAPHRFKPIEHSEGFGFRSLDEWIPCPYGKPGERLWVRETWQRCAECGGLNYRAALREEYCRDCDAMLGRWKPSIHMFREYSRILLEVTDVRVERLQAISEEDAEAEGCGACVTKGHRYDATDEFAVLWDSINGKRDGGAYAWANSPWVWVVAFKVV